MRVGYYRAGKDYVGSINDQVNLCVETHKLAEGGKTKFRAADMSTDFEV